MPELIGWLLLAGPLWAAAGAWWLPRRYRQRGRDPRLAGLRGGLAGAALGPLGVAYLLARTPAFARRTHLWALALLLAAELGLLFRAIAPNDPCVTSPGYVADQIQNGLTVGAVYATMAVGLTLIFSVLGVVSFTHGQFVMLGGVLSYLLLTRGLPVNALFAVPLVGLVGFALGAAVERLLLSPMHGGGVERKDEYAILITFGFGIFLQYAVLGALGPTAGLIAPSYTSRPLLGLDRALLVAGPFHLRTDFLIAGAAGALLVGLVTWFLRRTWTGRSLRAVSMDSDAAAVAGIDSAGTFTFAFALGSALASMAGAVLVPVLAFSIPDIASRAAVTSYVIIVLGGLGSVPGAFLGGLAIGVVEALGAGCYPDPSKGAVYETGFALLIFAVVLLVRPQGLFGREA